MRRPLPYLILAIFGALQVHATGSQWNRRSNFVGNAFREAEAEPSTRLRQTTWKEINDRQVSRTNPNYRRQMASSAPFVYPTCSVLHPGTVSVARYTQVQLTGIDASQVYQGCDEKLIHFRARSCLRGSTSTPFRKWTACDSVHRSQGKCKACRLASPRCTKADQNKCTSSCVGYFYLPNIDRCEPKVRPFCKAYQASSGESPYPRQHGLRIPSLL